MNTKHYLIFAGLAAVGVIAAFALQQPSSTTSPDSQAVEDDASYTFSYGSYEVVPEESMIEAQGQKPLLNNYIDTATLRVQSGALSVSEESVSGEVVIDMTSLTAVATGKNAGEEMLTRHLKSDDFFAVEQYPTATFTITGMSEVRDGGATVTGDLTIKGITHEVDVPVQVFGRDGQPVVRADFQIDRTLWDIRFGSGKFFENIGDNLIDDMFTIRAELVGKRVN